MELVLSSPPPPATLTLTAPPPATLQLTIPPSTTLQVATPTAVATFSIPGVTTGITSIQEAPDLSGVKTTGAAPVYDAASGLLVWTPVLALSASSTGRNTIQASGPTVVPLTLKGAAAQSADILDLVDSAGGSLLTVGAAGNTWIKGLLDAATGGYADVVIAASNSSTRAKAMADVVCTGTNDELVIQTWIDSLAGSGGGTILLVYGVYNISDRIRLYVDNVFLVGGGPGYPSGGTTYSTTPLRGGTILNVKTDFASSIVLDARPTGNIVTTLAAPILQDATSAQLTSLVGDGATGATLPASGQVRIFSSTQATGIQVSYTSIDGATNTLLGLAPVVAGQHVPPADAGARVHYGARSLGGIGIANLSIDGLGAGSPFVQATGIFFQAFASFIWNVRIQRLGVDGLVVDGGGSAIFPRGAWDNRIWVMVRQTGRDGVGLYGGSSDNQLMFLKVADWGRYGTHIEASPGAQLVAGHWYGAPNATGPAIHAHARQVKIDRFRISNVAAGGITIIGTTGEGGGFSITQGSIRDFSKGNRGVYDGINVSPTSLIAGGIIDAIDYGSYDDDKAGRHLIYIGQYASDVEIGKFTVTVSPGSDAAYLGGTTGYDIFVDPAATGIRLDRSSRPRVEPLANAATVTPNPVIFHEGSIPEVSQPLTIANPVGIMNDTQTYLLRLTSSTQQPISYGSMYAGSTDVSLPGTTTGSGKTDYLLFKWRNATPTPKMDIVGRTMGY